MKQLFIALMLTFGALATAAQTITVRSDEIEDADFTKYKTFYWASQVDNELDAGVNFLNDVVLKAQIRDAVKGEMTGLGYEINKDNADMIVNFRVFDKPVRLRGGEGYGPEYWGDQAAGMPDTSSYDLEAGSLIISFADRNTGRIVWQGFASGLINNNEFIKDEGTVREAVNLIFEEFGRRAKDYTRK
ncbi:MAG TPA: DUF4136 domain-containing protein [Chryseosolibacter sp.]|nr:DUF4136 domain-containing protein [Chryseosolibacter sp.]